MKIGIISDVHDHIPNLLKAIKILNKEKVTKVFFCGDLCSPFTIKYFQGLKTPIAAVFGNNEGDKINILSRIKKYNLSIEYGAKQGLFYTNTIKDKKIGLFHGHVYELTEALVNDSQYSLVLTGHTHKPHIKYLKNKVWINPGSIHGFSDEFQNKPSLAIFNLITNKGNLIKIK
ncbi:YfcE family phosphodiesterase [Candidatus Beckwithbacteria bacterium CG10_big_fil_rev_8_21_14_0_10_34_10]|uniref:Phosphoesterase n=1 Tax=Candidatus Beckwithbacteria bacterium CG10_big_fil_rev_8_21_14_0_10_34_10 TaxID=1974495 RepID=A0A2H0WAC8_9BACT|nr:MAG: YfcE family phosphodiesterase [Candidatus Beckwithbacteria bacterium CG10_big_fil_rev_8_21_14_0_10_34_10]